MSFIKNKLTEKNKINAPIVLFENQLLCNKKWVKYKINSLGFSSEMKQLWMIHRKSARNASVDLYFPWFTR